MSLAPYQVWYEPIPVGVAHTRQTIYSGDYNVHLTFPESTPEEAAQWIDAVSAGSVNATIIGRLTTSFSDLSGIYFNIDNFPTMESIYMTGFSLTINGVYIA